MVAAQTVSSVTSSRLAPDCIALPSTEVLGGERRLDAVVYLSDGYLVRRRIGKSALDSPSLGSLASVWQPSRLKGIQVEEEHGMPYLAATQIFDIWPTPRKWLATARVPDLDSLLVDPGWILVTRSGTVGNPFITYTAHLDKIISDDLLRVQVHDDDLRGYLYAFLRTRFGQAMMKSSHYGNVVKHLEPSHLEDIPVPILPDLVDDIGQDIISVFSDRDEAYKLDMDSRRLLEDALYPLAEPEPEEGFTTSASNLFQNRRRLDAFAHNPAAQFVVDTFRSNAEEVQLLGDVASAFVPSRFKRIYGDAGTPYLDSEPIFKVNPGIEKILTPATPIEPEEYMVKEGWLLMACSGQIYGLNGQAILANSWHVGKVVTQHIMRIIPKDGKVRSGYLQTVLTHPTLGQPVVVSQAYGTSVPELHADDIERLPIPRLAANVEDQIADMAEEASELRMDADKKENGAVSRLEEELEKELEEPGEKHGPLRIPMDFDEAMKRAMQVPPPPDGEAEEA